MIDQFERADKQFRATHDRLRDMAAEITVIHRRVERLEELGASKWIGSCRTQGLTLTNSRSDGSIMRWGRVQISLLPWTGPTLMSITRRRLCCRWSLSLPHCRSASSCQMHALPTRLRLQRRCIFRIFKVQLRVAGVVLQQQDAERRGHNTFSRPLVLPRQAHSGRAAIRSIHLRSSGRHRGKFLRGPQCRPPAVCQPASGRKLR